MKTSSLLEEHETLVIMVLLVLGALVPLGMTFATDGGGDLLDVYVPAVMQLLAGHNPYLTPRPWTTNYPPLFFLLLASIAGLGGVGGQVTFDRVVLALRMGLVVGHVLLGGLVYLGLKKLRVDNLARVVIPGLVMLLPSFLQLGEAWFHGDIFGLLLLAGSLLFFQRHEWLYGSLLLSLSAAFKLHPFLALPLVAVWLFKRGRLTGSVAAALFLPFLALTLIPLVYVPGLYDSFVVQNLNARPSWSFSIFILAYRIVPAAAGLDFSTSFLNQLWTFATAAMFSVLSLFVYKNWRSLTIPDVVCLAVAVWLIPLKQMFHYYAFWAIVPFILRGKSRQTIFALVPFEVSADISAYSWAVFPSWTISTDPFMLLLSMTDTIVLILSICVCAFIAWKTCVDREKTFLEATERITVLAEARD